MKNIFSNCGSKDWKLFMSESSDLSVLNLNLQLNVPYVAVFYAISHHDDNRKSTILVLVCLHAQTLFLLYSVCVWCYPCFLPVFV